MNTADCHSGAVGTRAPGLGPREGERRGIGDGESTGLVGGIFISREKLQW